MEEDLEFRLKPSHAAGFLMVESANWKWELYDATDDEIISEFRQAHSGPEWYGEEGNDWHSDELIVRYRDTLRKMHENPDMEFRLVWDVDSVCGGCSRIDRCRTDYKPSFDAAETEYIKAIPELEIGKVYKVKDLFETEFYKRRTESNSEK